MGEVVLAIDQGTSGTTALLINRNLQVLASHTAPFNTYYPKPGYVEQDAMEIWQSVGQAVQGVLARAALPPTQLAAIGVTNQRETTLFWNRRTGKPIHRALVWQDRRTTNQCETMRQAGLEPYYQQRTGLVLDPYFSATKARWLLDTIPGARPLATTGDLCFGTIDAWLAFCLTGEHVTDPSNASRTLLYDLHTLQFSDELLAPFAIPRACLPRIGQSSEVYGTTRGVGFLPDGLPLAGLVGDQQGALFGQACFDAGMAKCTYGTGAFVLLTTGEQLCASTHGMLSTIAWQVNGRTTYALEGSAFVAGAAVQWLRDGLGLIRNAADIEALARTVPDSAGVVFVPALAGLGAPYWQPNAKGLFWGLTQGTTAGHLARAVLDGIALQMVDVLRAMATDSGKALTQLRVDGGASRNNLLMQRQADLLGIRCIRPAIVETTALGSALLAGLAVGLWHSPSEVARSWTQDRCFEPAGNPTEIAATLARWQQALSKA